MRVLLIEDNPGDARLVQEMLREAAGDFRTNVAERLGTGLEFLGSHEVDVVLLDLGLPDSRGLGTLTRLQKQFPYLPVVIMTSTHDEALGVHAVNAGAQDYLVKGQVNGRLLGRALAYAVERKKNSESLKEREQFLERLAELNPAVISITDLKSGRETYSSKPGLTFLGYGPEETEDIPSLSASVLYPGDIERMAAAKAELKQANDDRVRRIEIRARDAGGRWRWFDVLYVIFKRDRNGLPVQTMSVARDVTERKEAEQIKDEFIGLVSHELRTPLTVFMGAVKVAMTEGLTREEVQELLKDADQSAVSLGQILDNLIELSRYQSNRLRLATEPLDVLRFIRDIIEAERARLQSHTLLLDAAEDLPSIQADRIRLRQILRNLLDNAAKYSPPGSEIRTCVRRDGGQILVSVADRGKGISRADQEKLFQAFQRLDEGPRSANGLGLGLLVCRRLVEAHGGRIWCESAPQQGAVFCFTLPLPGPSSRRPRSQALAQPHLP